MKTPAQKAPVPDDLLSEERRRSIARLIEEEGRVLVKDLARRFAVSTVTARTDLSVLHHRGQLQRVHGGAIATGPTAADPSLREKAARHGQEKAAIAQAAARLVVAGQTIILDSGSTTTALARLLARITPLTVITNAVNIATELAGQAPEVILTGGALRENSFSLVGPLAEETLSRLYADHCFLGVDGIDAAHGITTPNLLEAKVNQVMISIAREVTVVTDGSKFGHRSLCQIGSLRQLRRVITDTSAPAEQLRRLRQANIEVVVVAARAEGQANP